MKTEVNISLLVDKYLDDRLSTTEKEAFIERLQYDRALREELHHQQRIAELFKTDTGELMLEEQLNAIYAKLYAPLRKKRSEALKRSLIIRITGIAASVAIVAYGGIRLLTPGHSGTDIYTRFYVPAEMNMSYRTASEPLDALMQSAMQLYKNRQYADAIPIFEELFQKDSTRVGIKLYEGISYMELEQFDRANGQFALIIQDQTNAFVESAEWYLGLCYLKTDRSKALRTFEQIEKRKGYYSDDARRILRKIE